MREDPKLQLIATHQSARTYHFRSAEQLGGWALCTVNDVTGELLIVSDWGSWSHLWNPKHIGSPSLTHFIADRQGYDYLANKLLGPDEVRVLDADATIARWRKKLCAARLDEGREGSDSPPYYVPREKRLDKHLAREIWDRIGSLVDDERHEVLFIERALAIEGFKHWVSNEPWDETEHCYSHAYRLLVDFLLPALAAACRDTISTPREVRVS